MRSLIDHTRTVLTIDAAHFNKGLKENWFTPEGLEKITELNIKPDVPDR